jgi:transcriptional regulator with XRE-family HTH domain
MQSDVSCRCDACGAAIASAAEPAAGVRPVVRCDACRKAVEVKRQVGAVDTALPAVTTTTTIPHLRTRSGQRAWMRTLGSHVRRTRELLRMTQGQLAAAAGTSQAAVSRLEQGGALGTPYLVVLAVQQALGEALSRLSRNGGVPPRPYLAPSEVLIESDASPTLPSAGTDEDWLRYVAAYRSAPPALRSHLVVVVEAVASAVPSHCS